MLMTSGIRSDNHILKQIDLPVVGLSYKQHPYVDALGTLPLRVTTSSRPKSAANPTMCVSYKRQTG